MTTEPKMPPLPEWSKRDDLGGLVPSEIRAFITERDQQWAERVAALERENARLKLTMDTDRLEAQGKVRELEHEKEAMLKDRVALAMRVEELERVLDAAREALKTCEWYDDGGMGGPTYDSDKVSDAIATIDASRSKEGQHHD